MTTTTLTECSEMVSALALTLGVELDEPQLRAYHRALSKVPASLLRRAIDRATSACDRFPKPAELLRLADVERRALLDAHPFVACVDCTLSPGWRPVLINGVERLARCACYRAWQQSLDRLGVTQTPLAIAERVESDIERVS